MKPPESTTDNCPSVDSLERLLLEVGDQEETAALEAHVEYCRACQQRLSELTQQSPILERIQAVGGSFDCDGFGRPASAQPTERSVHPHGSLPNCASAPEESSVSDDSSEIVPELDGYEILHELGRGASGIVYKARDCELNRFVALKVFSVRSNVSNEAVRRFRQEAKVIARLRHENIVQVHGIGEQNGCRFLSLELIEGSNLARWLGGVPRPIVDSTKIVETLARAVHYAHSCGVIHRDLKPSNVLLGLKSERQLSHALGNSESLQSSTFELKITDFGLAKCLSQFDQAVEQPTQSGMIIGTPSYVAPEQARGETHETGPTADIYALGAILYELLTGRPPFRGATAIETLLLAAHEEPVSPRRLAPRMPRDLETICLKCLEKAASRRYTTALDLADDLARFRKHEPIVARPLGRVHRCLRWMRRRPGQAAMALSLFLAFLAIVGFVARAKIRNAERFKQDDVNLREVSKLQGEGNWMKANALLEQTRARLEDNSPTELQLQLQMLDEFRRNHELVDRLERIRLDRATVVKGPFNHLQADADYAIAFREAEVDILGESVAVTARKIAKSSIGPSLIAAMDDWTICASDATVRSRLMDVARLADPDPWRDRVRDPSTWNNRKALVELVKSAQVQQQSVQLLIALADRLKATGADSIRFLTRVQAAYPGDFWANFWLAAALTKKKSPDAISYFRAAIAVRPSSAVAYNGLGSALCAVGRLDDAIEQYHRAIDLEPEYSWAYASLGSALRAKGSLSEAIEQYRKSVELDPPYAWGHYVLANALRENMQLYEAVPQYRKAIELQPTLAQAHYDLGMALIYLGQISEAIDQCERALELNPKSPVAHFNLGCALVNQNRLLDAIGHFELAINEDPKLARAHECLGSTLIQLGKLSEAEFALQHALELLPTDHPHRAEVVAQLARCRQFLAIDDRLENVLSGEDQPDDVREVSFFAELCFIKQQYADSAQLFTESFARAGAPQTEEDHQWRLTAARAAILAAGAYLEGSAVEAVDGQDTVERQWYVEQALGWLESSRAALAANTDHSHLSPNVVRRLSARWLSSTDLAPLRDEQFLATISPSVASQCRAFWQNVDALLKRLEAIQ